MLRLPSTDGSPPPSPSPSSLPFQRRRSNPSVTSSRLSVAKGGWGFDRPADRKSRFKSSHHWSQCRSNPSRACICIFSLSIKCGIPGCRSDSHSMKSRWCARIFACCGGGRCLPWSALWISVQYLKVAHGVWRDTVFAGSLDAAPHMQVPLQLTARHLPQFNGQRCGVDIERTRTEMRTPRSLVRTGKLQLPHSTLQRSV